MEHFTMPPKENLTEKEMKTLCNGLDEYTGSKIGEMTRTEPAFLLHNDWGDISGGLWVREGIGGCRNSHLTTSGIQAGEFYKKLGFSVFRKNEEYPEQHCRCGMRKKIG